MRHFCKIYSQWDHFSYCVYKTLNIFKFKILLIFIRQTPVKESTILISNSLFICQRYRERRKKKKTIFSLIKIFGTIVWYIFRIEYNFTSASYLQNVVFACKLTIWKNNLRKYMCGNEWQNHSGWSHWLPYYWQSIWMEETKRSDCLLKCMDGIGLLFFFPSFNIL